MKQFDVIILGAGAAGLFCAKEAGQRGRSVLLLDHNPKPGAKILVSGGGRCNFTNIGAGPDNFLSSNPHFCKSALSRYTSADFIELVNNHGISYHEKKLGQLFCDGSAQEIVDLLLKECEEGRVQMCMGEKVQTVEKPGLFKVWASSDLYFSHSLVVATGGLSIPKLGATDFGLPACPPIWPWRYSSPARLGWISSFPKRDEKRFGNLMGVSVDCLATCRERASGSPCFSPMWA